MENFVDDIKIMAYLIENCSTQWILYYPLTNYIIIEIDRYKLLRYIFRRIATKYFYYTLTFYVNKENKFSYIENSLL